MWVEWTFVIYLWILDTQFITTWFRNSGAVFGKQGKVTFAVRGCHGLEVPLSDEHGLIVSNEYLRFIIEEANKKMLDNEKKIARFSEAVHSLIPE